MPLICKECSNKTEFERIAEGHSYWTERQIMDETEDPYEWLDREDYDEETDEYRDITCNVCGSDDVEDVTQEAWEAWEGPQPEPKTWKDHLDAKK